LTFNTRYNKLYDPSYSSKTIDLPVEFLHSVNVRQVKWAIKKYKINSDLKTLLKLPEKSLCLVYLLLSEQEAKEINEIAYEKYKRQMCDSSQLIRPLRLFRSKLQEKPEFNYDESKNYLLLCKQLHQSKEVQSESSCRMS